MAELERASTNGSPFWQFSVRFYGLEGVAPACLSLQDEAGIDVNLLLFLLWCASNRRCLSAAEVDSLEHACAPWRRTAVIPLRALRRALKSPPALIEAGAAEAYRRRIKAVELEAERLQQQALSRLFEATPPGELSPSVIVAARANLAAYAAVHDSPFDTSAIETLIAAFAKAQNIGSGEATREEM